ncbi:unnamed protein product, partial [Prorocentrum cordatum]
CRGAELKSAHLVCPRGPPPEITRHAARPPRRCALPRAAAGPGRGRAPELRRRRQRRGRPAAARGGPGQPAAQPDVHRHSPQRSAPAPSLPASSCVEAVLVEPRRLRSVQLALETASLVRDGSGKEPAIQVLTLMHGTGNQEYVTRLVEESEHLREDRRSGRLRLIPLGSTDLGGDLALLEGGLASSRWHSQYSSLFYNMSFWESLKCDHVLTMQSDSLLCLNSKVHLSEFFNYDFVGAVSCGGDSNVSNGGLSLRNRQVMMRCVRRGIQDLKMQEDVFFSEACRDVARAPDLTVRDRFAIEQGFRHANVTPFGLHKPWHQEKSNQYRYVDQNLDMCEGARKLVSMQHE